VRQREGWAELGREVMPSESSAFQAELWASCSQLLGRLRPAGAFRLQGLGGVSLGDLRGTHDQLLAPEAEH
jgi:hypothetical protein